MKIRTDMNKVDINGWQLIKELLKLVILRNELKL